MPFAVPKLLPAARLTHSATDPFPAHFFFPLVNSHS